MGFNAQTLRMADVHGSRMGRDTAEMANQNTAASAIETGITPDQVAASGAANDKGSIVGWLLAVLFLLIVLRFFASKAGDADDYSALAPTFYNVMVITLASVLGLTFTKFLAARFLAENNALRTMLTAA